MAADAVQPGKEGEDADATGAQPPAPNPGSSQIQDPGTDHNHEKARCRGASRQPHVGDVLAGAGAAFHGLAYLIAVMIPPDIIHTWWGG